MKEETSGWLAGLSVLGMYAAVFAYSPIDRALHARSEQVETSRGTAVVINWNKEDHRGVQVGVGGSPSLKVYSDTNRDGTLDDITHMFGAPRRGVIVFHPAITLEDQRFYDETLSKVSTNTFPTKSFNSF